MQQYQDILVRRDQRVGWITIDRPQKANALRDNTFHEIIRALSELESDDAVHAIVLHGAGDRAFCGGVDLSQPDMPTNSREWDDHSGLNARMCETIWMLDKPVISAVAGHAVGTGCVLALICDITIVADNALFAEPEIRHGVLSPMLLLPWMTHMKPLHEFYYTGDPLRAEDALRLGLVNRVVPLAELLETANALAQRVGNAPTTAIRIAKRSLRQTYDTMGFRAAQMAHRYLDNYLLDGKGDPRREQLLNALDNQGMSAFLELRDGAYKAGR